MKKIEGKERDNRIMFLAVTKHLSIVELAKEFEVSRQRIHQILILKIGSEKTCKMLSENRIIRKEKKLEELPTIYCKNCGKVVNPLTKNKTYCSNKCLLKYRNDLKKDPVKYKEYKRKDRLRSEKRRERLKNNK